MADVNGFKHTAFNAGVRGWSEALYPFPLYLYAYKALSEPQALISIDFSSPLYAIEQPLALTASAEGRVNCCVVWCEYYVGDRKCFEDVPGNWVSVFRNGRFENYKKQLLKFKEEPVVVKKGDCVAATAVLNGNLEFQFSFSSWYVCSFKGSCCE